MPSIATEISHTLTVAQQSGGGAGLFAGVFLVFALVGIVIFAVWLWALIDAIRNPDLDSNMRIVWVLVVVFTGIIGAIIYLIIGRNSNA